ncbi:hypothetical protein D3C73_749900 [compost metagenome]
MHPVQAAHIAACRADLAAEAGRHSGQPQRCIRLDDFVAVERDERYLRGSGQPALFSVQLIGLVHPSGEKTGPLQRLRADNHRHVHHGEAAFGQHIQRQPLHGEVQVQTRALQHVAARSSGFDAARNIDDAVKLAELHMIARREAEVRQTAASPQLHVPAVVCANRRVGRYRIWRKQQQLAAALLCFGQIGFQLRKLSVDLAHLRLGCFSGRGLSLAEQALDLLRQRVALRTPLLGFPAQLPPFIVPFQQILQREVHLFPLRRVSYKLLIVPDPVHVQHAASLLFCPIKIQKTPSSMGRGASARGATQVDRIL